MPTISQLLTDATAILSESDSARLDAEVLLAHTLNKQRSYLYSHPEEIIDADVRTTFHSLVEKRRHGTPVAHLTGQKEFWSLSLRVTKEILIPRPDTELLVEQALKKIPTNKHMTIADPGTGSGAIALAIASERPLCHIIASDRQLSCALAAKQNAERAGMKNISFICADWISMFTTSSLDILVSNPPYIAEDDPHLSKGDVRFEPHHALAAGSDGLDAIRKIIKQGCAVLKADGWLLLEHGYDQEQPVQHLLSENNYTNIKTCLDLAGHPRVSLGKIKK